MLLVVMVWSLLVSAAGQQVDDEWLDPHDMLNYDPNTQRMRKPAEPTSYSNEATRRREYIQEEAEATSCTKQVEDLQEQIEDQKKMIVRMSQQPIFNPVYKGILSRLQKEIQRVGVPTDSTYVFYDAKIKLSQHVITWIRTLLEGEGRWETGALDAISEILVDLKPHGYETWKWRFEDTFGVELDTVLKIGLGVLIIEVIICTELWSRIPWFTLIVTPLIVCFLVSIVSNWFNLYMIAFAEHQNIVVKMDSFNEKCTGVKKIDWTDNLTEWYRSTWTLQDDPCKKYYDIVYILLVSPTKAIVVTITTFITEPLEHIGQGINEVLQVLLKDLPVTVQLLVFLTIVRAFMVKILVFMFNKDHDELAGGDAPGPERASRHQPDDAKNNVHQRRPNRPRKEPPRVAVETLRVADPWYSDDEADAARREESLASEQNPSADSEKRQEELEGATEAQTKPAESPQPKNKPINGKLSLDEPDGDREEPN